MPTIAAPLPATIHGLPVLTPNQAASMGFISISNLCDPKSEDAIMKSMAANRNPERACWIRFVGAFYELGRKRDDRPA